MASEKRILSITGILFLAYYLGMAFILKQSGIEHSEALFLGEKAKLVFEPNTGLLQLLATTYPSIPFYSTIVFSWAGFEYAPIIASCVFTAILVVVVLKDVLTFSGHRKKVAVVVLILFIFHPGILFSAVSGRSVACVLLFFYLMYKNIFRYYRTRTSYYLSMSSIYLTGLVFCNYQFIWLLFSFLPFMVLVSLEGLKTSKDDPHIVQYYDVLNNRSLRRKLIQRTVALVIIIFLLPLGAFLLFGMLNRYHAGSFSYFLNSPHANWTVGAHTLLDQINSSASFLIQGQFITHIYVLLLTPLLVLALIYLKGAMFELLTAISPLLLLFIILARASSYITIEYYLIFLIMVCVLLPYWKQQNYRSIPTYIIVSLVLGLNILTGYVYFFYTGDREEQSFTQEAVQQLQGIKGNMETESRKIASFLNKQTSQTVLLDDAAAYDVVVKLHSLDNVILPARKNFLQTIENPSQQIDYILIATNQHPLASTTILNEYYTLSLQKEKPIALHLVYETPSWLLYRIVKEDKMIE